MKRIILIILMISLSISLSAQTATEPSGEGSEEQPYQIATLENLYWMQTQGFSNFAIQTADINASETSSWFPDSSGGYHGWPVGTCDGNYDGQGYSIDSLYINRPDSNAVGLFGSASPLEGLIGEIKDLKLTNVDITGKQDVGALAGLSSKYNISGCSSSGTVTGEELVGGLLGRYNATFENGVSLQECYSSATVTADSAAGGLLGESRGATNGIATITACYARGSVTSTAPLSGGLIGTIVKSDISYCYATGAVSNGEGLIDSSDAGGEGGSTVTTSYWDYQTVGQLTSEGGDYKSTAQMKTQTTYSGWDFADTWSINGSINDGYPYLQANSPEVPLPITLEGFSAVQEKGKVMISWKTESEFDNARFLIYRNGEIISSLIGAGTTSEPRSYSYIDKDVIPGQAYEYILADISYANELVIHKDYAVTITIDENDISESFALKANYPNPFNPATVIPFELGSQSSVSLFIFDINGKLVRTLLNETCNAGCQEVIWDGKNNSGLDVESGMYIARLLTESSSDFIKMLLVK